jgi:hypothetical protein
MTDFKLDSYYDFIWIVTERICITQLAGTMASAVALGRGIMMVWKCRGVAFGVMLNNDRRGTGEKSKAKQRIPRCRRRYDLAGSLSARHSHTINARGTSAKNRLISHMARRGRHLRTVFVAGKKNLALKTGCCLTAPCPGPGWTRVHRSRAHDARPRPFTTQFPVARS